MSRPLTPHSLVRSRYVVHYPRVHRDLDPRSYLQGQGHIAHIQNLRMGHSSLLLCWIWIWIIDNKIFSQLCHEFDSRSNYQRQGHSSNTAKMQKIVSGLKLSQVIWMGRIFHIVIILDLRMCHLSSL